MYKNNFFFGQQTFRILNNNYCDNYLWYWTQKYFSIVLPQFFLPLMSGTIEGRDLVHVSSGFRFSRNKWLLLIQRKKLCNQEWVWATVKKQNWLVQTNNLKFKFKTIYLQKKVCFNFQTKEIKVFSYTLMQSFIILKILFNRLMLLEEKSTFFEKSISGMKSVRWIWDKSFKTLVIRKIMFNMNLGFDQIYFAMPEWQKLHSNYWNYICN